MNYTFPLLGFDIGGTKIAVCLANSDGTILGSKRLKNENKESDKALEEMLEAGYELLDENKIEKKYLRAIGIGSPAPMDIPNGLITGPPNMPKWKNVPVRDYIEKHFNIETFFDNDANAGALAEWIFGAGKGCSDMIYITLSTGIGGGIIANGHLLHGKDFIAGEIGHTVIDINGPKCNCGLNGCYEAFCGGRAVAERLKKELADKKDSEIVKQAGSIENIDLIALENACKENDEYALSVWDEMCRRNAQAAGMLINILNPERIVLGTLAWAAGDLFMEPFMEHLSKYCWKEMLNGCKISTSALGREIGEYSGIAIALNSLYEEGEWHLPWQQKKHH